ncbi:EmrB/QacA subfamily drug resistance transporter [Curtobacterium pusillum]|uniref:EmrB/QacA subfamily drug resistance transporter n=1 Tax=Curtobacterium pusillum TaxID=69373 RepID=A0AAW3T3N5_9MICO|nr:MFS transporter [Curtobacterium pusillum]MBA8989269.1 EmrB/QacA subfamily drug resistance transporter [Curtobacterium pusillum]
MSSARPAFFSKDHPRYKWVALSNTTLGMLMATINSSIVIISLPAIFTGIDLNPLEAGNVSYLLWMLMGYMLVTAVLVVGFGRLGDMFGRVRIYNAGFVVFSIGSIALALDPWTGSHGALWLIIWRLVQGVGGAMLFANSTAILTDAFPAHRRGMALGINQVAAIAGSFIGLIVGGLLSVIDWRAVFFVSVPIGIVGTIWSYKSLHEVGTKNPGKLDIPGNLTFAAGLTAILTGITYGIQPYGSSNTGWTNPWVLGAIAIGIVLLVAFVVIELRSKAPMFNLALFKIRAFAMANLAGLLASVGRGGLQFMLIIWLQGIWLPLHGYSYEQTPLWAGIYMLPITIGFLIAGPLSGTLSDRFGARLFATAGLVLVALTFVALLLIPVNFPYWVFAVITGLSGIGSGMFGAPNRSAIMNSVPKNQRGAASGMAGTVQNAGTSLSIGIFFSLMVVGLSSTLPSTLTKGLTQNGVPAAVAHQIGQTPPVSSLFAAFLGYNPIETLLKPTGLLQSGSGVDVATLTGKEFFPNLISGPFHDGLVVVFAAAAVMSVVAAVASLIRGKRYVHVDTGSIETVADPVPSAADGSRA